MPPIHSTTPSTGQKKPKSVEARKFETPCRFPKYTVGSSYFGIAVLPQKLFVWVGEDT